MATSTIERADWYDAPRLYDIVFDSDTRHEASFLLAIARRHGARAPERALEPACGSGRLVAELARRGLAVTGFDRSTAMLEYARRRLARRGLAARLVERDLRAFRFATRFELAHCLVSTFKYLLDERSARAHLRCVAAALAPGGVYVLGLHLTDYARRGVERERWVESRGATTVTCVTTVEPADRRTRREDLCTRLTAVGPRGTRRIETRWQFRTYDAAEIRSTIAAVPDLDLVAVHDFTYDLARERDLDDDRDDKVLVLRKR